MNDTTQKIAAEAAREWYSRVSPAYTTRVDELAAHIQSAIKKATEETNAANCSLLALAAIVKGHPDTPESLKAIASKELLDHTRGAYLINELRTLRAAHASEQHIVVTANSPAANELLHRAVKWIDRLCERKSSIPHFFDNDTDPCPLAKDIRKYLLQPADKLTTPATSSEAMAPTNQVCPKCGNVGCLTHARERTDDLMRYSQETDQIRREGKP